MAQPSLLFEEGNTLGEFIHRKTGGHRPLLQPLRHGRVAQEDVPVAEGPRPGQLQVQLVFDAVKHGPFLIELRIPVTLGPADVAVANRRC